MVMRVGPHENLAVGSIRHDVYGPGRFAAIAPGRLRVVEVHYGGHGIPTVPVVAGSLAVGGIHVRVVNQPSEAAAADCPPCDRGAFPGFGSDPPAPYAATVPPASPTPLDGPSDPGGPASATASSPGAGGGGFVQGQAVPGGGGMLDIMA
jgi:hypothetical protein